MCKLIVIALAAFTLADSVRNKLDAQTFEDTEDPQVSCTAKGKEAGDGMQVTFGLPKSKCMAQCAVTHESNAFTYEVAFKKGFTVKFNTRCECIADGKEIVTFKPLDKAQGQECATGTSAKIHDLCWNRYMRARGTHFETTGGITVPLYRVPFTPTDFIVHRGCSDECPKNDEGVGSCETIVVPGALHGVSYENQVIVGNAIKKVYDGDEEHVSDYLLEVIKLLPASDLDTCELAAIDVDRDGQLTMAELDAFFSKFNIEQMTSFMVAAGGGDGDSFSADLFPKFKDEMRNWNPAVDLIAGPLEFVLKDGVVENVAAAWKVVQVQVRCERNGKEVEDPSECGGTAEEAAVRIEQECR